MLVGGGAGVGAAVLDPLPHDSNSNKMGGAAIFCIRASRLLLFLGLCTVTDSASILYGFRGLSFYQRSHYVCSELSKEGLIAMEKLTEGYGLIEGPVWVEGQGLMYSDVEFGGVFCVTESGEVSQIFQHRRGIGGMASHENGGMIVSGRNISWKSIPEGETKTIFDRDEEAGRIGFNDITTDAQGRIYAGSLGSSPVFDDGLEPRSGDLYLIELDGTTSIVAEDIKLTNGLSFSPDGLTLYHSDSARQHINRYDVHQDGSLGEKQVFVTTEKGSPDGLVVSEDGRIWVALPGAGAVGVYGPDGSFQELIQIDELMCTSVCFGGDDLKDLYIVSGSRGADSDRAGSVYKVRVDVAGLEVPQAKISLPDN